MLDCEVNQWLDVKMTSGAELEHELVEFERFLSGRSLRVSRHRRGQKLE
jgi:hypothetical protein